MRIFPERPRSGGFDTGFNTLWTRVIVDPRFLYLLSLNHNQVELYERTRGGRLQEHGRKRRSQELPEAIDSGGTEHLNPRSTLKPPLSAEHRRYVWF